MKEAEVYIKCKFKKMVHGPLHIQMKLELLKKHTASQKVIQVLCLVGKRGNLLVSSKSLLGRAQRALESLQDFELPREWFCEKSEILPVSGEPMRMQPQCVPSGKAHVITCNTNRLS